MKNPDTTATILVAIDFSDLDELLLDEGIRRAAADSGVLHVIHVTSWPPMTMDTPNPDPGLSMQGLQSALVARVRQRLDLAQAVSERGAVSHVRTGNTAAEIVDVGAELDADLILVGTHGMTGVKRFVLGSVAEKVVRTATCPVLVMRQKAHSTPEIERPCPLCVATRRETHGRELWCDQHRHVLGRRHTYHFVSRNVAAQENAPLVVRPGAASEPLRH
jgi:nucleotide-binding universal stress UspA family protein